MFEEAFVAEFGGVDAVASVNFVGAGVVDGVILLVLGEAEEGEQHVVVEALDGVRVEGDDLGELAGGLVEHLVVVGGHIASRFVIVTNETSSAMARNSALARNVRAAFQLRQ